ncbi:MAG: DUF4911 domain-containing protein [Proteobacteria bacterium]|nr:DUF4911 domain-containing protein [Pseudomonadota bacterium]MBU4117653.1 DUF4911 domain-containing protein [Pseudomonadota bacterium]
MAISLANLRIRIDPEQIYFLKFIFEGYDNLTIMSTVDQREGVVELKYPVELEEDVRGVLRSMAERLKLEEFV